MPIRLTSFLCLWHMFCFSCQQFCPGSVCCQIWVLCLRWSHQFCLPSSSEDQAEQRLAISWAMGEVYASQSFEVCCYGRRSFPCCYPRAISSWESGRFLLKDFRRDYRKFFEDFVNCVLSTVAAGSLMGQGLSCFSPPILVGGNYHAAMQLFDMLPDGLLEKGWVRGAEMEACKS